MAFCKSSPKSKHYDLIADRKARKMVIKQVEFFGSFAEAKKFPESTLPEIAFLGRSNVGKSSLINSLLGMKRFARTSNTPGKTQRINFYLINDYFFFVDLPGYGYANVAKAMQKQWQKWIESYLQKRKNLILSILLVDSRHLPFKNDLLMKEWLEYYHLPYIIVLTKIDKSKNSQIIACERTLKPLIKGHTIIRFSAKTNQGKKLIWQIIDSHLNKGK
jgi:GTP-binding protein